MASTPTFVGTPGLALLQLTSGEGTATEPLLDVTGTGSAKVVSIIATSTDTSNRTVQLYVLRAGTLYLLGSTVIPAGAGTDGVTPAVNMLNPSLMPGLPVDNDGQAYLFLVGGTDKLEVILVAGLTSGKFINIAVVYGTF